MLRDLSLYIVGCWLLLCVVADVPVYVMLPLDAITSKDRVVNERAKLSSQLTQLKNVGVRGVSVDVWWGLVERDGPQSYEWSGYSDLFKLVADAGLEVEPILSYHKCGGNVGDSCDIPLPPWVLNVSDDVVYRDASGYSTQEYMTLGVDNERLFYGRTAVEMYRDFMISFRDNVLSQFNGSIHQVHISLGPAGELRYPSYPLSKWQFCGVGEFTCYDKYMKQALMDAATAAGHPEWGHSGPNNAGNYNSKPWDTAFFNGDYSSDYGRFFLGWYSTELLNHGVRVIEQARSVFESPVKIAAKIAGIHWWYNSYHHAAELTAGYYNTNGQDFYNSATKALKAAGADILVFTCLEMTDDSQPSSCSSGPYELVHQVKSGAGSNGLAFTGENALPRFDDAAYETIKEQVTWKFPAHGFTYLRLGDDLMRGDNLGRFHNFVNTMKSISTY